MKIFILVSLGILLYLFMTDEKDSELKKDLLNILEKNKKRFSKLAKLFVELMEELEGTYSDEVKANVSKRFSELQSDIGIISSDNFDISDISSRIRRTIDSIKKDISKGIKK